MKKLVLILSLLSAAFVAGVFFGHKFLKGRSFNPNTVFQLRLGRERSELINPLLACEIPDKELFGKLEPLRHRLREFIAESAKNNWAQNVSVYFRDLISGQWTGVNEDEKYIPASLVKVPLLLAYYRYAETNPAILEAKVEYTGRNDLNADQEVARPPNSLEFGKEYSVAELLHRMIVYSGNNSHDLLDKAIAPGLQEQVYSDLKVEFPDLYGNGTETAVTARSFSTFFRTLYNSTYLDREMSQRALELLAQANFSEGLIAGVPKNTVVAHKFAERTVYDTGTGETLQRELHDCGIIYEPGRPYVLCVMTKGKDFADLKKVISGISKITHENIQDF